jgi:hypothetical protein
VQKHAEHLGEETIECLAVTHPEHAEPSVTYRLVPDDPAEGIIALREALDRACTTDAHRDAVEPEDQQHLDARQWPPGPAFDGFRIAAEG